MPIDTAVQPIAESAASAVAALFDGLRFDDLDDEARVVERRRERLRALAIEYRDLLELREPPMEVQREREAEIAATMQQVSEAVSKLEAHLVEVQRAGDPRLIDRMNVVAAPRIASPTICGRYRIRRVSAAGPPIGARQLSSCVVWMQLTIAFATVGSADCSEARQLVDGAARSANEAVCPGRKAPTFRRWT